MGTPKFAHRVLPKKNLQNDNRYFQNIAGSFQMKEDHENISEDQDNIEKSDEQI